MQPISNILDKVERELVSAHALLDSWLDRERAVFDGTGQSFQSTLQDVLDQTLQSNDSLLYLVERGRGFMSTVLGGVVDPGKNGEEGISPEGRRACPGALRREKEMPQVDRIRRAFRRQLGDGLYQVDVLKCGSATDDDFDNPIANLVELDTYQYLHFIALQTRRCVVRLQEIKGDVFLESV